MMKNENFDGLTTTELQALITVGCTELADRWLNRLPDAREHIAAGAGLLFEVGLMPLSTRLMLIDSDGQRYPLAMLAPDGSLTKCR